MWQIKEKTSYTKFSTYQGCTGYPAKQRVGYPAWPNNGYEPKKSLAKNLKFVNVFIVFEENNNGNRLKLTFCHELLLSILVFVQKRHYFNGGFLILLSFMRKRKCCFV